MLEHEILSKLVNMHNRFTLVITCKGSRGSKGVVVFKVKVVGWKLHKGGNVVKHVAPTICLTRCY